MIYRKSQLSIDNGCIIKTEHRFYIKDSCLIILVSRGLIFPNSRSWIFFSFLDSQRFNDSAPLCW